MTQSRDNRPTGFTEAELHRHGHFLERLARTLVADEHECEDLVQGALAAALASQHARPVESIRAWLASVVRNAASNLHRDRDRRRAREIQVARPESQPPDPEIAGDPTVDAELELQTEVVRAVQSLREPYRTAIHLRYFRDLPPSEIAKRLSVPATTVDTRLLRGRKLLREALTRASGGDAHRWMSVLLPLAFPELSASTLSPLAAPTSQGVALPSSLVVPTLGALVGMKFQVALVITVTAAIAAVIATREPSGRADPERVALATEAVEFERAAAPGRTTGTPLTGDSDAILRERKVVSLAPKAQSPKAEPSEPSDLEHVSVEGRVIDVYGRAQPAIRVRFEAANVPGERVHTATATTDAFGHFTIDIPGNGTIRADEVGFVTVLDVEIEYAGHQDDVTIVTATEREMEVRVADQDGRSIGGATVEVHLPDEFRSRIPLPMESSGDRKMARATDGDGVVRFERTPMINGLVVAVSLDGYETQRRRLAATDLLAVPLSQWFTLVHLETLNTTIRGRVVDAYGDSLPDTLVSVARQDTRTDRAGRFFFDLPPGLDQFKTLGDEPSRFDVVALSPGYLPAALRPEIDDAGKPIWPSEILLQIVEPTLSISGRVVDGNDKPLKNYMVHLVEGHLYPTGRTLEGELSGASGEFVHSVRTDSKGRFELTGLLDEDYELAAIDTETLLSSEPTKSRAGESDMLIVVDLNDAWTKLSGRVVDLSGAPVSEVLIEPFVTTQTARGANGLWSATESLGPVTTDGNGDFIFENLPRRAGLVIHHTGILHQSMKPSELLAAGASDDGALTDVHIAVTRRLSFQVVLDLPGEADALRVLDEEGGELELHTQTADGYWIDEDNGVLTEGRSRHLFVSEKAATLVLSKDGVEVRRVRLVLKSGVENVVTI